MDQFDKDGGLKSTDLSDYLGEDRKYVLMLVKGPDDSVMRVLRTGESSRLHLDIVDAFKASLPSGWSVARVCGGGKIVCFWNGEVVFGGSSTTYGHISPEDAKAMHELMKTVHQNPHVFHLPETLMEMVIERLQQQ